MCLIAHLLLQERRLPLRKRPGEGRCFGVAVGLEDEDGLGPLEPVEDDLAGGAVEGHPPVRLVDG